MAIKQKDGRPWIGKNKCGEKPANKKQQSIPGPSKGCQLKPKGW